MSIDAAIDGPPDAPPAGPKAYVIDHQNGIYQAMRSSAGDLSLGSQIIGLGSAAIAVTSKDGKHLFVLTNDAAATIYRYQISAIDGTLSEEQTRSLGSCVPWRAALHPTGRYLLVGCMSNAYSLVPIDPATGMMGNVVGHNAGAVGTLSIAFTPDGTCMFLGEPVSTGLHSYTFDVETGAATSAGDAQADGPVVGLGASTDGTVLYVADDDNLAGRKLTPYQIATSCSLTKLTPSVTIGSAMRDVVVHPDGTAVFVIGQSLYAFNVTSGAPATLTAAAGSPFTLPGTAGFGMRMGVIDPQFPTKLYMAGSDTGSPYTATLSANVVAGGATLVTGGSNTSWIAVAP